MFLRVKSNLLRLLHCVFAGLSVRTVFNLYRTDRLMLVLIPYHNCLRVAFPAMSQFCCAETAAMFHVFRRSPGQGFLCLIPTKAPLSAAGTCAGFSMLPNCSYGNSAVVAAVSKLGTK